MFNSTSLYYYNSYHADKNNHQLFLSIVTHNPSFSKVVNKFCAFSICSSFATRITKRQSIGIYSFRSREYPMPTPLSIRIPQVRISLTLKSPTVFLLTDQAASKRVYPK